VSAKHAISRIRAPDEPGAEERAWSVMRAAYPEIVPAPRRRPRRRLAQALILAGAAAVLVLSSALASVRLFTPKTRTVVKHVPAVSTLPAPGSVLVSSRSGTWTLAADGTARRLGPYPQATWSPRGLYVAVAAGNELRVLSPEGKVIWVLGRLDVHDPRWYAPSGYRIAYLSGDRLRVVTGDNRDDHLLAAPVAQVAPAWRPNHPYELAYVTTQNRLVIADADSGALRGGAVLPGKVKRLAWSADGARLLALTPSAALIYAADGRELRRLSGSFTAAALSPDGRTLALVRGPDLVLAPAAPGGRSRRVLSAAGLGQLTWSPDGDWLLASWSPADQWLFVSVTGAPRIVALSHVHQQFRGFPQLEGWCCAVSGVPG
jgi:hypothetical protein